VARIKYRYNTKSLEYERVEVSFKEKLLRFISYVVVGLSFAIVSVLITYQIIDSPKEKQLQREIENLQNQYEDFNDKLLLVSKVLDDVQQRDDNIYRVIFEADPIPSSIRKAGFGGVNRYMKYDGYDNSLMLKETAQKLDIIQKQLYIQSKSLDDVYQMAKNKAQMLASIPAIQPISNKDLKRIASGFGYRIHPVYKTGKMHTGIDFTAPKGTEIYATGDGIVINSEATSTGYGRHVIINHGYGYQTLYGHMNRITVHKGQKLKRGDLIGYVGNTGSSTGPHLHYEVIKDGEKVNPVNYFYNDLNPEEYDLMLEISSSSNQSFD
jgi:murein DD-endopeptidase MepM/ murein hydrolase activator NlpD